MLFDEVSLYNNFSFVNLSIELFLLEFILDAGKPARLAGFVFLAYSLADILAGLLFLWYPLLWF